MNNDTHPEKDAPMEKAGDIARAHNEPINPVVRNAQSGFARPRRTLLDEHEQKDEEPIVARHESGFTRVRTAKGDAHEQKDEQPIVSRHQSAYTRKRTESSVGDEGYEKSAGELDFSTPINQFASKPPRRQK